MRTQSPLDLTPPQVPPWGVTPSPPGEVQVSWGLKRILTQHISSFISSTFPTLFSSSGITDQVHLCEGLKTRTLWPQMTPCVPDPKHCWSSKDLTVGAQRCWVTLSQPGTLVSGIQSFTGPESSQRSKQETRNISMAPHCPQYFPEYVPQNPFLCYINMNYKLKVACQPWVCQEIFNL